MDRCRPRKGSTRSGRVAVVSFVVGLPIGVAGVLAVASFAALPPVPFPSENPFSEPKRVLGKILFFDEQMSTANVVACASCHVFPRAGADPRLARNPGRDGLINTPDDILGSPGIIRSGVENDYEHDSVFGVNPQITDRSANSPINAAYAPLLFWDGRASGRFVDPQTGQVVIAAGGALESQAAQPIINTIEMAHAGTDYAGVVERLSAVRPLALATQHTPDIAAALADRPMYADLFERAFGDPTITAARIAMAIATYQRTLISDRTPYDRFVAGEQNALTPQQQQGLQAFQASRCSSCHSLANDHFTDFTFRNIGLRPPAEDPGRRNVTNNPADRGRFKVPGLRNVGLKRSFMHNGQFPTLTDVIRFYARAPGAAPQFPDNQDPIMAQVNVPPQAAQVIQDLLQNGLTDPRVANGLPPFDAPVLFAARANDQATIVAPGTAGTGGFVPIIIAQSPSMIGNSEYRLGLGRALPGATARLGLSATPPMAGRITPTRWFDAVQVEPGAVGEGVATQHWPLTAFEVSPGQVLFAQWFVDDPAAPGGVATSGVARIPFFCGSMGCPTPCGPGDFNSDGVVDFFDLDAFVECFETGACGIGRSADITGDGFVDYFDLDAFVGAFEIGC